MKGLSLDTRKRYEALKPEQKAIVDKMVMEHVRALQSYGMFSEFVPDRATIEAIEVLLVCERAGHSPVEPIEPYQPHQEYDVYQSPRSYA